MRNKANFPALLRRLGCRSCRIFHWLIAGLCFTGAIAPLRAALQFDFFLGYDGQLREANWFPAAFEVYNDGPGFNGVIELSTSSGERGQVQRIPLELPTNTRKRAVIPVFPVRYATWTARLLDERGKVRAEQSSVRPQREISVETVLLGSLARTFAGLPSFPAVQNSRRETQPAAARLNAAYFPDNPMALEGLSALYLSSEKAVELKPDQVNALLGWLRSGGHLVVGVEQAGEVNALPWLRKLLPCELGGGVNLPMNGELQRWVLALTNPPPAITKTNAAKPKAPVRKPPVPIAGAGVRIAADGAFEGAELPVVEAAANSGRTLLSVQGRPLIMEAPRGLGRVTALLFSPEREPFNSWQNRPWFWARLTGVPFKVFSSNDYANYGGWAVDAVFGALIDSRQARKLPFSALFALLAAYLLVIGPVDYFMLRRMKRTILTWVTFPAVVLVFAGLIYWIGFALRAGDVEWNELHVVDVVPFGERADLRGRTFASVYSPSSARYRVAGDPACIYSAWRTEFAGGQGGMNEGARGSVSHRGDGFDAQLEVPVWVSQLYVCDWWRPAAPPLAASVSLKGEMIEARVENKLERKLTDARLVAAGRVFELGELPARAARTFQLETNRGMLLAQFASDHGKTFPGAVQQRRQAFGDEQRGRLENPALNAAVASFLSKMDAQSTQGYNNPRGFLAPAGFDLAAVAERGDAVLLAWDAGNAFIRPLNNFPTRRGRRDSLLRLTVPLAGREAGPVSPP